MPASTAIAVALRAMQANLARIGFRAGIALCCSDGVKPQLTRATAMAEPDPDRPMRDRDRAQLEALASGIGGASPLQAGQARYEMLLRDREYAEEQEKVAARF